MQLDARLVHGVKNNASAIESNQVVFTQRKRISAYILSAPENLPRKSLFSAPLMSVHRPLLV
jgi:hypothetical protein